MHLLWFFLVVSNQYLQNFNIFGAEFLGLYGLVWHWFFGKLFKWYFIWTLLQPASSLSTWIFWFRFFWYGGKKSFPLWIIFVH